MCLLLPDFQALNLTFRYRIKRFEEVLRKTAINFQAMKRMGTPQEIADLVLWLCSDQSSFITGIAMAADGGALA